MNRILLACIALALPSFAAAAPCDILPYANQCQGSNLWPVPAEWAADNNGDCQPQSPTIEAEYYQYANGGAGARMASAQDAANTRCAVSPYMNFGYLIAIVNCYPTMAAPWASGQGYYWQQYHYDVTSTNLNPHRWDTGQTTTNSYTDSLYMFPMCQEGATRVPISLALGTQWTYENSMTCHLDSGVTRLKSSDGICTARWTSSAKTALQKDPLDPDCDANSCIMDGTCMLR